MADDINPARRTELENELNDLAPKIRGLDDLALVSISSDLSARVVAQANVLKRRRDLIQAEVDGMDNVNALHAALLADGYPSLPNASVIDSLFAELKEELADIEAAVSVFSTEAANVSISLGTPSPKA